jgi:hypothetical protein
MTNTHTISSYGSGPGYGYSYGDGDGYGYGSGDGNGYGDGYGSSYGYGYNSGSGYGDGSDSGSGYGDGSGSGYGDGCGSISGSGYGDGYGDNEYWLAAMVSYIKRCPTSEQVRFYSLKNDEGVTLAYWKSNKDGTPANGGKEFMAQVGLVQEVPGPLKLCTSHALHGTLSPDKWGGNALWIVALFGDVQVEETKMGALKREIVARCY